MDGVKIYPLEIIRTGIYGETLNLNLHGVSQVMGLRRIRGCRSGFHYHEGTSPSTNPERMYLLEGALEIYCRNILTGDEFRQTVTAPAGIEIGPNIYHQVEHLDNNIILELGGLEEHMNDTTILPR